MPITGSAAEITDTIARFPGVGVTRVEIHPLPHTIDALEQLAPVFAALAEASRRVLSVRIQSRISNGAD